MERMRNYVAGFMIAGDRKVALVKKCKPEWQRGRLNGIGGKIEDGETPYDAMAREFLEETGFATKGDEWHRFAVLSDDNTFCVHFFCRHVVAMPVLRTMEEEEIVTVRIDSITTKNAIPNLTWLIPMALTIGNGESARCFVVCEGEPS